MLDPNDKRLLKFHREGYQRAMQKSKNVASELEQVEDLKKVFKNNKVRIVKYNYAIDDLVQNFSCYDAFLQLSKDEQ